MSFFTQMTKPQRTGLLFVILILFIDMLLYSLLIPIVPYFSETLKPSSTMMGVLFSSYAVAMLVATPIFGPISDRIGRRIMLLIGLLGLAASTLLFAFSESMTLLITARFVQGISAAATWPTALALLADLFPPQKRGAVMGTALTAISTGTLLGAPIGGWLFEISDHRMPFLAAAAFTLLNIVLVFLFLKEETNRTASKKLEMGGFIRNPQVVFIAGIVLLAEVSLCLLEPTLPLFFTEKLGTTPTTIGLLFAVMTLAYGMIAPVAGSLSSRYNPYKLMFAGILALAIFMPFLVWSGSLWQAAIAMALVGAGVGFTLSPTLATLGGIIDEGGSGAYGTAYSLFNMFHGVGMVAGPLLGGILTDLLPVSSAIPVVAAAVLGFGILLFVQLRASKTVRISRKESELKF
ncbi:tetracycline resistance MFS efflux pump [Brevibacillus reuszeri]|uniref:Arabinose ABC transporter permease n=1 Tax=Brevibacillus reuszeri TaxID=54915 RepID=A0A0K9YZ91_9BACL|nr:MFS transporter [Brevibacillus reuszeri]KNB74019.1 arabinose ABC transporter permease [Brevibacillus reuszeri]MED1859809.1 MFS transporter [Brevibacillus reuszeri]GED72397.1 tetracycline resistance MFS efflux pump [Brevibacillus reuszeri]